LKPELRLRQPAAALALLGLLTVIVLLVSRVEPFLAIFWYFVLMYSLYSLSWNIAGGLAGLFSLGHSIFFGTAAFLFAHLTRLQLNPVLSVILAAAVGTLTVGPLVPALKLRGPFFMLSTYALSVAAYFLILNADWFSGGGSGIVIRLEPVFTRDVVLVFAYCLLALGSIVFILLKSSYFGLAMASVRDDEEGAQSLGIPPARVKVAAIMLSAFFAGLAGSLHAFWLAYVHVDAFNTTTVSLLAAVLTLLGGKTLLVGSLLGGFVNSILYFYVTAGLGEATLLFYGALLAAVVLIEPDGVAKILYKITKLDIFNT
jgi:branched-chain amino acid transport system permease protein